MYKIDKVQKENHIIHKTLKIVSIITYIIIIPIIIYNLTLIIKSFISPDKTPSIFGYKNFIIVSGSMEPTIMTGDAIFVKEVQQSEITINDIISFSQNGEIITHRIIEIIEEYGIKKYKTKGDNNKTEDKEKITYEQIEGKYQFKINNFGTCIRILKNKTTLIVLIVIISINYLYTSRINNRKQARKLKRRLYNKKKENEE